MFRNTCISVIAGVVSLLGHACAQQKVVCPDGEVHFRLDVNEVAIRYEGLSVTGAVSKIGPLSSNLTVSATRLQDAAAATQQENEFIKALFVAYNGCAIDREQFSDGLLRLYPQLDPSDQAVNRAATLLLHDHSFTSARRLLLGYFRRLQESEELAKESAQQILLAVQGVAQKCGDLPGSDLTERATVRLPSSLMFTGVTLNDVTLSGSSFAVTTQGNTSVIQSTLFPAPPN